MKTYRRFLLAAIFGLALTFSCSSGGGDDGTDLHSGGTSSPSSGGGGGNSIVNADNEAWLRMPINNMAQYGYIFKPNGVLMYILTTQASFTNPENAGKWCLMGTFAYSISGDQLCINGECKTYSINVDTFTSECYGNCHGNIIMPGGSFLRTSGTYIISGNCIDVGWLQ